MSEVISHQSEERESVGVRKEEEASEGLSFFYVCFASFRSVTTVRLFFKNCIISAS